MYTSHSAQHASAPVTSGPLILKMLEASYLSKHVAPSRSPGPYQIQPKKRPANRLTTLLHSLGSSKPNFCLLPPGCGRAIMGPRGWLLLLTGTVSLMLEQSPS